jgi:hypothetical protein
LNITFHFDAGQLEKEVVSTFREGVVFNVSFVIKTEALVNRVVHAVFFSTVLQSNFRNKKCRFQE